MTLKRKGPLPGPFQPSKLKYKCPVFECKSTKIRGDRIAEHFQSSANLIVLDKCNEDVHESAAIATFQTNNENKSRFPKSFWSEYIYIDR